MPDVMTTDALLEVVSSIDPKRWGSKLAIVAKLGRWPDGTEAGYRDIAEVIGVGERWVWRLVRELVDDHVLELVQAPAGRRPGTYRVNPWIGEWRNVPWTRPWELVFHRAFALPFHVEPEGQRGATTPVVPRSRRGTSSVVPRSRSAALRQEKRFVPRSRTAAQDPACAAPLERGTTESGPSVGVSLLGSDSDGSSPTRSASPAGEGRQQPSGEVRRLRDAVLTQAGKAQRGAPFLNGRPLDQLADLWTYYGDQYGLARMLELVAQAPPGLGAPMVVKWLADELELGPLDDLEDPPAPTAERTRAEVLEAELADLLSRGYSEDDDVVQDRRHELRTCEDQRATNTATTTTGGTK